MKEYNTDTKFRIENLRIDDAPVTLYNTLYRVTEEASDIKGFWLDDSGKLYEDKIRLQKFSVMDSYWFKLACQNLFKSGEKAVFYTNFKNQGIIEYPDGSELDLKNRIEIIEEREPKKDYILLLCQRHGGLTLHKLAEDCYLIEIYKERQV